MIYLGLIIVKLTLFKFFSNLKGVLILPQLFLVRTICSITLKLFAYNCFHNFLDLKKMSLSSQNCYEYIAEQIIEHGHKFSKKNLGRENYT